MRVDLDAKVVTTEGEELGTVQRAVVNPETSQITDLVISTGGLLGRDVLLPIDEVERAARDGDTIRLSRTKDEVEKLPDYVATDYVAPPAGWMYPGAYAFGAYGGYVWPVAYSGYVPPELETQPEEERDELTIGKGAVVFDRNGDDIGVVDDVRFDAGSGRLQGFVLRIGGVLRTLFGGGDTLSVDRALVDRVAEGAVYLRVDKGEIERRTD